MELYIRSTKHGTHVVYLDAQDYYKYFINKTIGILNMDGRYYAYITIKRKTTPIHRIIMNSFFTKMKVDHIDGNSLDNRKQNLRICTNTQNIQNSKVPKNSKTGYKGVTWCKRTKKYRVNLMANRKYMSFGYYDDLIIAAKKYNEEAIKYHGEYAFLNKIPNE